MIGIDIGSYAVKAVEIVKTDDTLSLIDFRIKERRSNEAVTEALKELVVTKGFSSKEAYISVSGPIVLVRLVEMPQMRNEELKSAVRLEAEKDIPFNIDDAVLDYRLIEAAVQGRSSAQRTDGRQLKNTRVLFAAGKKDFIKSYIEKVQHFGFSVKGVDIDGVALSNAFLNTNLSKTDKGPERTLALLNIGNVFTNLSILSEGIPFVVRDITGAGKDVTDELIKGMGVSREEACQIKHDPPADKQEAIFNNIRPVLDKLLRETRLSLGYFENQFGRNVEALYMSGGSSHLVGLKEFLSETLEIPVTLWDPFDAMKVSDHIAMESLNRARQALAVAVGLAIRGSV